MLEATSLSVFGNLLSAGLARIGTLSFHKVARINKIEQHLKSGSSQATPVKNALSDLTVVIGRCYGPYTETLHQFLEELQKTGIVGMMASGLSL